MQTATRASGALTRSVFWHSMKSVSAWNAVRRSSGSSRSKKRQLFRSWFAALSSGSARWSTGSANNGVGASEKVGGRFSCAGSSKLRWAAGVEDSAFPVASTPQGLFCRCGQRWCQRSNVIPIVIPWTQKSVSRSVNWGSPEPNSGLSWNCEELTFRSMESVAVTTSDQ